ncbi:MAG: hypothetical protein ABWU13_25995, partial [Limnospira maxima]
FPQVSLINPPLRVPQSAIIPTSQLDKPAPRVRDRPREKPANYIHPPQGAVGAGSAVSHNSHKSA